MFLFFLNLAIFFLHQDEMDVDREAMHMGIQAPDDFMFRTNVYSSAVESSHEGEDAGGDLPGENRGGLVET
jgi:DUF1680 family protein